MSAGDCSPSIAHSTPDLWRERTQAEEAAKKKAEKDAAKAAEKAAVRQPYARRRMRVVEPFGAS